MPRGDIGGKYHIVDPLVLDLDGDGIETVAANRYNGALFDHNKDGIRVATGWVGADDGLLVLDRDGDGIINNGNELFELPRFYRRQFILSQAALADSSSWR